MQDSGYEIDVNYVKLYFNVIFSRFFPKTLK